MWIFFLIKTKEPLLYKHFNVKEFYKLHFHHSYNELLQNTALY